MHKNATEYFRHKNAGKTWAEIRLKLEDRDKHDKKILRVFLTILAVFLLAVVAASAYDVISQQDSRHENTMEYR